MEHHIDKQTMYILQASWFHWTQSILFIAKYLCWTIFHRHFSRQFLFFFASSFYSFAQRIRLKFCDRPSKGTVLCTEHRVALRRQQFQCNEEKKDESCWLRDVWPKSECFWLWCVRLWVGCFTNNDVVVWLNIFIIIRKMFDIFAKRQLVKTKVCLCAFYERSFRQTSLAKVITELNKHKRQRWPQLRQQRSWRWWYDCHLVLLLMFVCISLVHQISRFVSHEMLINKLKLLRRTGCQRCSVYQWLVLCEEQAADLFHW